MRRDHGAQLLVKMPQPLAERIVAVRVDRSAGHEGQPRPLRGDHAPAHVAQAGVDAEDADGGATPARRRRSGVHLGQQLVRHFGVEVDLLHVVVVLERADQLQDLLARLVVDRHRVLGRHTRPARRGSPNFCSSAFDTSLQALDAR